MGRTLLIPSGKAASQLNTIRPEVGDVQPICGIDIYETIDNDIYSEHYSSHRDDKAPVPLYEDPDAAIFNPLREEYIYHDIDLGCEVAGPLSNQSRPSFYPSL